MLILSRTANQSISIGPDIIVRIVEIRGQTVRIGIEASQHTKILRGELTGKPVPRTIESLRAEEADEDAKWREWSEAEKRTA